MRRYPTAGDDRSIDWTRKLKGGGMGFMSGTMIGGIGSLLHTRGRVTPQTLPAALFLGTILGVGYAIRT